MKRKAISLGVVATAAAAIFAMGAGCSGCLWLAVPSLAYQGYKYETSAKGQSKRAKPRESPSPQDQGTSQDQGDIE